MQVSRVNQFFARMGRFQVTHRWLILSATIILTIAACLGLPHLSMSSSDDEWFDDRDQIKLNQEHFYDIFGSDDSFRKKRSLMDYDLVGWLRSKLTKQE